MYAIVLLEIINPCGVVYEYVSIHKPTMDGVELKARMIALVRDASKHTVMYS